MTATKMFFACSKTKGNLESSLNRENGFQLIVREGDSDEENRDAVYKLEMMIMMTKNGTQI